MKNKTIDYAKYEKFTKGELIEMLEREKDRKDFWNSRTKAVRSEYEELARCYKELWKSGTTKTGNLKVGSTLEDTGFIYDMSTGTYESCIIVEETSTTETKTTEKEILLRDIMWIVSNGTPIDFWMDTDEMSFMSIETPYLNGICLVPETLLNMEIKEISAMEENSEGRLSITLKS